MRQVVIGVITAAMTAVGAPALAAFTSSAVSSGDFATATLQPATDPAVAHGTCSTSTGDELIVTWTATTSGWADGYTIWRAASPDGVYEQVGSVSDVGTTTYTDAGLPYSQAFSYIVRVVASNWTSSATTPVSATTRSSTCS